MKLDRAAILAMEPGKELDALIAEYVMGWRKGRKEYGELDWYPDPEKRHGGMLGTPAYSIDIAAAWDVLTKMEQGNQVSVYSDNNGKWACEIGYLVEDDCDAAPEAICKAALLTKLESEG